MMQFRFVSDFDLNSRSHLIDHAPISRFLRIDLAFNRYLTHRLFSSREAQIDNMFQDNMNSTSSEDRNYAPYLIRRDSKFSE